MQIDRMNKVEVLATLKGLRDATYADSPSVYEASHDILEILKLHAPNTLLSIFTDAIYNSGYGMDEDLLTQIIDDVNSEM